MNDNGTQYSCTLRQFTCETDEIECMLQKGKPTRGSIAYIEC